MSDQKPFEPGIYSRYSIHYDNPYWEPDEVEKSSQWANGRDDRLNKDGCRSTNVAYLEGWYSVDD